MEENHSYIKINFCILLNKQFQKLDSISSRVLCLGVTCFLSKKIATTCCNITNAVSVFTTPSLHLWQSLSGYISDGVYLILILNTIFPYNNSCISI